MSQSIITAVSTSLLEVFAQHALGPIVAYINEKKGHTFTVQELSDLLKLPASQTYAPVSHVAPRIGTSLIQSFGSAPVPGVAPPSGKGKRGAKSKIELSPRDTCLYLSRGVGKRCTNAKARITNDSGKAMAGFCKTCSEKAAGANQYDTYVARGLNDDAIMMLETPYDKTAFTAKPTGGRKPKGSTPTTAVLPPQVNLPSRPLGRSIIPSQQTSSDGKHQTPSGIVYMMLEGKAVCIGSTQKDLSTVVNTITQAQKDECELNEIGRAHV